MQKENRTTQIAAGFAALGILIATHFYLALEFPAGTPKDAIPDELALPVRVASVDVNHYANQIAAGHLFGNPHTHRVQSPTPRPRPATRQTLAKPRIEIRALLLDDVRGNFAVLSYHGKPEAVYRPGDEIHSGFRLTAVKPESITVEKNGQSFVIERSLKRLSFGTGPAPANQVGR